MQSETQSSLKQKVKILTLNNLKEFKFKYFKYRILIRGCWEINNFHWKLFYSEIFVTGSSTIIKHSNVWCCLETTTERRIFYVGRHTHHSCIVQKLFWGKHFTSQHYQLIYYFWLRQTRRIFKSTVFPDKRAYFFCHGLTGTQHKWQGLVILQEDTATWLSSYF